MPTVLSHPAVPLALGLALGPQLVSRRLLLAGVVASVLPDLDVVAFRVGIGYSHELGHRGVSHSLAFALLLAFLALALSRHLNTTRKAAFLFVLVSAASHGLLDMLTNGGLGVAFLWPFTAERFFFSLHPIEASPLSLRRVFGPTGIEIFGSELLFVWLPCAIVGLAIYGARRKNAL